jgi:hypothetical protein
MILVERPVVVGGYANFSAKLDAQKDAAHTAQFHIGIQQYCTGSTKRNQLFSQGNRI